MSDTLLVDHGLQTVRRAGIRLYDAQLPQYVYSDALIGWLIVGHIIEANIFQTTNLEAAYERLSNYSHNGRRSAELVFFRDWNEALLLVDPKDERAVHIAAELARSINLSNHIDPPRYQQACITIAEKLWGTAAIAERLKWLKGAQLSMRYATDPKVPIAATSHIVEACRL